VLTYSILGHFSLFHLQMTRRKMMGFNAGFHEKGVVTVIQSSGRPWMRAGAVLQGLPKAHGD
jgi:hypothetical protein